LHNRGMTDPPALQAVLETVLYYDDQDLAEGFYVEILGMRLVAKQPGRSLFFRAGRSVFLLFDAIATRKEGGLPPHGATGPGHVCFVVDPAAYEAWKRHLVTRGVEILKEVEWPGREGRDAQLSFYFRDPYGNLLEIADGDLWPE
jgi:catechol 2,3-dioxygenase-like lactoylglutathione lyase family enzyme